MSRRSIVFIVAPFMLVLISVFVLAAYFDHKTTADVIDTAYISQYETEPAYGMETSVANAVAEIHTELHPLVLLDKLLEIENSLGRVRDPKTLGHGPRTIDCDLCWVESEEHHGDRLELPHPGVGERDYVLVPMEDLMPDPVRFLSHAGVRVTDVADRVGQVLADLGPVAWESAS